MIPLFRCQLCPFRTQNSVELTIHTRFHTGMMYDCLRNIYALNSIDLFRLPCQGDSPYVCTVDGCSKAFKTPSDLLRHSRSRTHSGIRPHACQKCEYRSAIKSNLVAHMKKHHTDSSTSASASVIIANPGCPEPLPLPKRVKTIAKPKPSTTPTDLPFDLACKSCPYKCDTISMLRKSNLNVLNTV